MARLSQCGQVCARTSCVSRSIGLQPVILLNIRQMAARIVTEGANRMLGSTNRPNGAFPPFPVRSDSKKAPRRAHVTASRRFRLGPVAVAALCLSLEGCGAKDDAPPRPAVQAVPQPTPSQTQASKDQPSNQGASTANSEKPEDDPEIHRPEDPPPPHAGPWIWVTRSSAAVYENPKPARDEKIGYIKRGGRIPILEGKVEGPDCPKGWFKVVSGGYICSHVGTTDESDKDVKFRPSQPNVEEILPYQYARNAHNGTPLYKSIPTKKQTLKYEPYLPAAKEQQEKLDKERQRDLEQMKEAGLALGGASGEDEEIPLWEREEDLHEVTLEDLRKEGDEILAQRMMKGFYIAIDKTFKWDGRTWYKTTKGLVTPSDRFWQTAGSEFQGVALDGEKWKLPVAWVFGARKTAPTYEIDLETNERKPKGSKKHFEAVQLEYDYHRVGDTDYLRMADGDWIRDFHVRMTTPGPRPKEVGESERWIDVDISEQTLVVFEGDRPIYATLISSGKESKVKEQDHSTPRGMWRVREKHIASTMDGDGTAAGDLPYSIEDVPYIMYFHKSYATHGAFWHRNYGVQMSHGCVNLAPLDAKWVFYHSEPPIPEGFHGAWSSETRPGTWVVVHD